MTKSILYPLQHFYDELGVALPLVRQVSPEELPVAEKRLLAHQQDMTPTLEAAHGGKLQLRVLRYAASDQAVNRLVALMIDGKPDPVGMGAIHIFMERLPHEAKKRVLEWRQPFGGILLETGVIHYSRPVAFFDVIADAVIKDALGLHENLTLYGRRNTIWNSAGEELADVVEILPPPVTTSFRSES